MRRTDFRRFSVLALAVLAFTFTAAGAGAATVEKSIDRTVAFNPGGQVVLENVNGHIVVETWDRNEVHLRVDKKVKASSQAKAEEAMGRFKVDVETAADRVRIVAHQLKSGDGGWLSWLTGNDVQHSADFHLTVPRRAVVSADSVNGRVEVSGLEGAVKAETINGQVLVENVAGGIEVSTVNGKVQVRAARGSVSASTVNGGIDVELAEVTPGAEMSFETTNGGVDLALPATIATRLDARSTNGGISTDFAVKVEGRYGRRSVTGDLNGGGSGEVKIRTTNGGIRIREL